MTAVIVLLVVVVVAGLAVNLYRRRPGQAIESGISSFRREMRALAPRERRSGGRSADRSTEGDAMSSVDDGRTERFDDQREPDERTGDG